MALTKVSGEVITRPLVLTGNASVSGIMTVGIGSTTTTIDGSQDFPTIRPTLDLNFAATKTLDRRITFTRDSIGTYTDELGIIQTVPNNVPRFDHDPETGESLGLLIEESRTNLITYSENFVGNYTLTNVTLNANSTISPSGNSDATTVTADITNSTGVEYYTSFSNLVNYTISLFVKRKSGSNSFVIRSAGGGTSRIQATFSLENETSSEADETTSSSIISYPNGWFKCSVSGPVSSDENRIIFLNSMTLNEEFYIWGAQLEQASFPTSYIPTSGSTVTRAADIPKIEGTNLTDFYNSIEGTVFTEYQNLKVGDSLNRAWSVELNANQVLNIIPEYNQVRASYFNSIFEYSSGDVSATQDFNKVALGFKTNNTNLAVNGTIGEDDTSISLIDFRSGYFNIGRSEYYSPRELNGCIRQLSYYNKRLTNSQLQSLTRQ